MPVTYGLTFTGFTPKTQDQARTEINASIQAQRGVGSDVSDGSLVGQWAGIISEREGALWAILQQAFAAMDPDQATGSMLDALCALTGIFRVGAFASTVTETLTGTPNTVVNSGSQFKGVSTGNLFNTTAAATIATLAAWASSTAYTARVGSVLGSRVTNGGNAWECTTGGTSANPGPTGSGPTFTDGGGVVWTYLGVGTGAVDVAGASVSTGPVIGAAGDLTVIQTPVGGWSSCFNFAAALLGANAQSDSQLRVTRVQSFATNGNATQQALLAKLLQVASVTNVNVLVNNTDVTDSNGQSPHSVQAVVLGGANADVATALYNNVAAGVNTVGTTQVQVADSQGVNHPINFTRPTPVTIYVDVTLTFNNAPAATGGYPTNGDTLVAQAIANFGAAMVPNQDVSGSALAAALYGVVTNGVTVAGVPGVVDVSLVKIGTAPSPSGTARIDMTPFQIASILAANVTVHSTGIAF